MGTFGGGTCLTPTLGLRTKIWCDSSIGRFKGFCMTLIAFNSSSATVIFLRNAIELVLGSCLQP